MNNRPVWDLGGWTDYPLLEGNLTADVCVVGLGGSGLAGVDEAIGHGQSVIGIDAGSIAGEAAGRNGGFLLAGMSLFYHDAVSAWGEDESKRFYQKTLQELEVILSQPGARNVGSLRIAADNDELVDIRSEHDAMVRAGFPAEEYEGVEGQGVLLPWDGVCNPMLRCRTWADQLSRSGAQLFQDSPAIEIAPGRVVTPNGSIEADRIVVAVDGRLERLLPELASRIHSVRLEMVATEPFDIRYTRPVYTHWGYNYWQQLEDGRLAFGGLRNEFEDASYTTEDGPSEQLQDAIDSYLLGMGVEATVTHRWAGHAGFTNDRLPIYEEHLPGVWVVGGYCGHGNVIGAIYARAAVRSALAGEREPLLEPA